MNIYTLLKYYRKIRSPRLKLIGILFFHLFRKRYLYLLVDPSLSCNFRCRLCFFSDPETAASMKGHFSLEDIQALADSIFHRALKIQIGCGAEPMTYANLPELVKLAHDKGIRNISVTTNGSLLTLEKLRQLVDNGLSEIILSAHGFSKERYEYMMRGGSFDHFLQLLKDLATVKECHPHLLFRINYTMCEENIEDIKLLPSLFKDIYPDVLQLRPVQDIGSKDYDNYSMTPLQQRYEDCIMATTRYCKEHDITCIYPQEDHLNVIADENEKHLHLHAVVDMLPGFYLAPYAGWKDHFNPYKETFESYAKRTHRVRNCLKMLLGIDKGVGQEVDSVTHSLNYTVK